MVLRFEEWLTEQQSREDLIGALARVPGMKYIVHKSSRHKSDEHKEWADIVIEIAEPGYVAIFNVAWQEFLLAKQRAEESLD